MRILARDPVREEFAGCSSSDFYYPTKGHAVSAFDAVLRDYGYCFDESEIVDMHGDEGRVEIPVCTDVLEGSKIVGRAILTYYRMFSGRYEVIGYLA